MVFWRITNRNMLANGSLYFEAAFWRDEADAVAGQPPLLTEDFITDVTRLIGRPKLRAYRRVNPVTGNVEHRRADNGQWADDASWPRPSPGVMYEDLGTVTGADVLPIIRQQVRRYLVKHRAKRGDRRDRRLAGRSDRFAELPAAIRAMATEYVDD